MLRGKNLEPGWMHRALGLKSKQNAHTWHFLLQTRMPFITSRTLGRVSRPLGDLQANVSRSIAGLPGCKVFLVCPDAQCSVARCASSSTDPSPTRSSSDGVHIANGQGHFLIRSTYDLQDCDTIQATSTGRLRLSKPNKYWVESSQKRVPGSVIWRWIRLFVPEDAAAAAAL